MNPSTRRHLNQINREFYQITATDFDATRQRAWQGWERLLVAIDLPIASVLDLACGNGRFAPFLVEHQNDPFAYCGIDNNAVLLAAARRQLAEIPQIQAQFIEQDLIFEALPPQRAQLVLLFGLLHHVPGEEQRRDLLRSAAELVLPGGHLAIAAWRFYEQERFRQRILPWSPDLEVERHDYLLDWRRGKRALRYCHYIDDAEHEQLISASGLTSIADYRADGATGDLNRYTILRKEEMERA